MENAIKVGEETMVVKRAGALRNAADGKLTADEAAEVISTLIRSPKSLRFCLMPLMTKTSKPLNLTICRTF